MRRRQFLSPPIVPRMISGGPGNRSEQSQRRWLLLIVAAAAAAAVVDAVVDAVVVLLLIIFGVVAFVQTRQEFLQDLNAFSARGSRQCIGEAADCHMDGLYI